MTLSITLYNCYLQATEMHVQATRVIPYTCIAGNICGIQVYIADDHFTGLILVVRQSSMKTMKIGPLENFPLYNSTIII